MHQAKEDVLNWVDNVKTRLSTTLLNVVISSLLGPQASPILSLGDHAERFHLRINFDLENTFQSQEKGIGANIQGDGWGFGSMAPLTLVGVSR